MLDVVSRPFARITSKPEVERKHSAEPRRSRGINRGTKTHSYSTLIEGVRCRAKTGAFITRKTPPPYFRLNQNAYSTLSPKIRTRPRQSAE